MYANMRPFSLTCISGYAYTPRYAYTDVPLRVYTYPPSSLSEKHGWRVVGGMMG